MRKKNPEHFYKSYFRLFLLHVIGKNDARAALTHVCNNIRNNIIVIARVNPLKDEIALEQLAGVWTKDDRGYPQVANGKDEGGGGLYSHH